MKTIITYYSESGSTAEIGNMLIQKENCLYCKLEDLLKLKELHCELLIVGSPNKYGKLAPDVVKLLRKHKNLLSQTPVIIYFTCMDFCREKFKPVEKNFYVDSWFRNNLKEKMSAWDRKHSVASYINNIEKSVTGLNIQSMAFFKGRLNFSRLNFFDALVMRLICLTNKNINPGNYLKKEDVNEWINSLRLENVQKVKNRKKHVL
jgi:menaquinone-dependent protoporphyrinogen IX oxidase